MSWLRSSVTRSSRRRSVFVDSVAYLPDELTPAERELYISVPNGQGRSKLMEDLTKRRQPPTVTVRNWRTVMALAELTATVSD